MRNYMWLVVLVLALLLIGGQLWIRSRINILYPVDVRQQSQLHSIRTALELRSNEFDGYPPSDANDPTGTPYCGAMKLCEAVMGRDLTGVHSESLFRADGLDGDGGQLLYPRKPDASNLAARKGPYLQPERANAYRLVDIYGEGKMGPFDGDIRVLCDTYIRKRPSGVKTGMPILYYRADPNGSVHDVNDPDNPLNIYDYRDNQALLALGVPGELNAVHPLARPRHFYLNMQSDKIASVSSPYNRGSFILISAASDGLYGTADDICNFEWKYRE